MRQSVLSRGMFACNVIMFVTLMSSALIGWRPQQSPVLTVERLNIVDSTGRLALVLSNGARLPGAMFAGREYPQSFVGRGKSAGMIFFNEVGDEVGGLIYEGARRDSAYRAFGHLSFDQWQQNQVVAMQYQDNGSTRSAGIRVWDRPTNDLEEQFALALRMQSMPAGPARDSVNAQRRAVITKVEGTPRLLIGSENRVSKLELRDPSGRVRARLGVDAQGTPRLEFLDETGKVVAMYPPGT